MWLHVVINNQKKEKKNSEAAALFKWSYTGSPSGDKQG